MVDYLYSFENQFFHVSRLFSLTRANFNSWKVITSLMIAMIHSCILFQAKISEVIISTLFYLSSSSRTRYRVSASEGVA